MRQWRRRRAGWTENVAAALIAAGVGAATFYVTRLLVAREELDERPPSRQLDGPGGEHPELEPGDDARPSRLPDGGE